MRYVLLASAVVLLIAVPKAVSAAGPGPGVQIINNNYNFNYQASDRYGGPYGPVYGSRYGGYRPHVGESHDAAVRRIQATHSRFRQYVHPRSMYNGPPSYYDWRGW